MLDLQAIEKVIPDALEKFEVAGDLPHGKVRDFYVCADGKRRVLISTDRMTVFNHQVGLIPYKGQILNQLSAWWFERTGDILSNHVEHVPDPNVMVVRETMPIPLEVIVRSYITGTTQTSLWTRYAAGEREIYGIRFPEGLKKNEPLPEPLVTPTTKSPLAHDERSPLDHVVDKKILAADVWERIQAAALALFKRGQEAAARGGLIMVDSKYEFGYDALSGELLLIDEVHTPDSSRFWIAESYPTHMQHGEEPDNYDRELVRLWFVGRYPKGKAQSVRLDNSLIVEVSRRYQIVYERVTGHVFEPAEYPAQSRIEAATTAFA